jgi:hypothetical protein
VVKSRPPGKAVRWVREERTTEMRKLFVVGIVLLLLSGLVALALLNLNQSINRNKDVLLARVQQRLGRAVTVEEIHVAL